VTDFLLNLSKAKESEDGMGREMTIGPTRHWKSIHKNGVKDIKMVRFI
jgi:hypothetical protein